MSPNSVGPRAPFVAEIGRQVVRFQVGATSVDQAAACVLGLEPSEVTVLSVLWFGGTVSLSQLCERLDWAASVATRALERLVVTGYAERVQEPDTTTMPSQERESCRYATTPHARRWIDTLWGPLASEGERVSCSFTPRELAVVARYLDLACSAQEAHGARLRALLAASPTSTRTARSRGGLSPAALRRVQLFVESNLTRTLRLADLAERAGLSAFHFARAFKASTGVTPRVFIEQRRVARAQQWIRDTTLPLARVALEAGFASQSQMTTAFRKTTGVTPARYRERPSTAGPRRSRRA